VSGEAGSVRIAGMSAAPFGLTDPEARAERRGRFWMRGLRSIGYGALIGLLITGLTGQTFWITMIHSMCIAVLCWFFIDLGRVPAARWKHRNALAGSPEADSNWPGWPLMFVVIVIGSLLGFTVGGTLAEWLTGYSAPGYLRGSLKQTVALVLSSLVPALIITYWFYSREAIAGHEAAAQLAQRQAAENQLKLLESQLEPHMLFNTLANLRVLIGTDPPRAQAMLDQLIAFLRATLNASRSASHPLEAEFARLRDYLALMELRMGDRLHTRFELPAELAGLPLPPLLLQPLVENSIKHGLEPKVEGGRIEVRASRVADELVLEVRDTGVGLADTASDGTRFGLTQVRERLATLYGARARLSLAPCTDPDGGTIATIRLPLPVSTS
jgi:signal transduction histidine kinase